MQEEHFSKFHTFSFSTAVFSDYILMLLQIELGSVAERCGRLYIGDQILQINGTNVRNRQEAMSQFARESERIVLMLARPSAEVSYLNISIHS